MRGPAEPTTVKQRLQPIYMSGGAGKPVDPLALKTEQVNGLDALVNNQRYC